MEPQMRLIFEVAELLNIEQFFSMQLSKVGMFLSTG